MDKKFEYPRDFKGIWIPKEVWLDDDLSHIDKFILAEINSLDNEETNGCYASNEYIAKFCKCSVTKVSTSISKLIGLGYVKVEKVDGRYRWLRTNLFKFNEPFQKLKGSLSEIESQTFKKCKADFQKLKESNTSNNTNINIEEQYNFKKIKNTAISKGKCADVGFSIEERENLLHDMYCRIGKICKDSFGFDNDMANKVLKAFQYYCMKYSNYFGEPHPILKNDTLHTIIESFTTVHEDEFGNVMLFLAEYTDDEYIEMVIDKYFKTDFGMPVDYNIAHFASENILSKIMLQVGL